MKTIETEWEKYSQFTTRLSPGDEVKFSQWSRKLAGKTGVFERQLPKNLSIIVDGINWRVSPGSIDSFRRGDYTNLMEANEASPQGVRCNPDGLTDCSVGDIVLFFRGKFDVVKITRFKNGQPWGNVVGGRSPSKVYGYKKEWFVQKLENFLER